MCSYRVVDQWGSQSPSQLERSIYHSWWSQKIVDWLSTENFDINSHACGTITIFVLSFFWLVVYFNNYVLLKLLALTKIGITFEPFTLSTHKTTWANIPVLWCIASATKCFIKFCASWLVIVSQFCLWDYLLIFTLVMKFAPFIMSQISRVQHYTFLIVS